MGAFTTAWSGAVDELERQRLLKEKQQDQARSSTLQMLSKNYDTEAPDLAPMARHQRRAQMFSLAKLAPQDKANLLKSSHSQALSEMQQNVMEGGAPAVPEPTQAPAMGTLTGLGSVPTGEGTATVGEVPEATKTPLAMPSVAQGRLDELQQERRTHPSMSFARREAIEKESAQMRLVEVNRLTQEEVTQRNKNRQLADIEGLKGEISPEIYQRARVSAVAGPGVFSGMETSAQTQLRLAQADYNTARAEYERSRASGDDTQTQLALARLQETMRRNDLIAGGLGLRRDVFERQTFGTHNGVPIEGGPATETGGNMGWGAIAARATLPTTTTRSKAEHAQVMLENGDNLISLIQAYPDRLGPVMGNINNLKALIGSEDPAVAQMAAAMESFLALQPFLHGARGIGMMNEFRNAAPQLRTNPAAAIARVQQLQTLAREFIGQNKPRVVGGGKAAVPSGEAATEGTKRRNKKTGEVQIFRGGQWQPLTPATIGK